MDRSFKCAQFIDTYYPQIDGVINTVNNYALALNKKAYCCVVAPRYKNYDDTSDYDVYRTVGIQIPFYKYTYGMPVFDPKIYRTLLQIQPNIVHAHSPFELGKLAQRIGARLNVPVVATFHTKFYDDFKQIFKSDPIAQILTDQVIHFYEKCDCVWAVNESTASTMRDYGYNGDVIIMPNGTDMNFYHRKDNLKADAIKKYDLPSDKKLILFVGQITWKKNLKLVIDSIERLRIDTKREDFMMLFVGTSYCESEIQAYAEEHIPNCYKFLGQTQSRELLAGLYAAAYMLFFPSVYDNAPLVVREAAQMHLPSLLIENSNAAEGVIHCQNGFLCSDDVLQMSNRLNELLSNPDMVRLAGDAASATIPVSWNDITEHVFREYKRICRSFCSTNKVVGSM